MRIRTLLAMLALATTACTHPSVVTAGAEGPAGSLELVVAATTDIHGRVRGWNYDLNAADPAVGLARAATIVDSLRAETGDRVVLVDAGDIIQGNALGFVAARVSPGDAPHPVMAAMNAMRYDAAAVGNHEFNYGVPFLERTASQARFPLLAANARRPDGSRAFRGWTIVERGGVKVGIVGATTPGSMVWDRDNLRGRVVVGDILPAVREAVGEARRAGAQVVVVTMHSGLAEPATYDTVATGLPSDNVAARVAREVPGIDLIAYGHSHKEMADTTINGVLLMQAKNWVQSVAIANLRLVREGSGWRVASKSSRILRTAGHAESPAVIAATESAHRATIAWVTTPIGRTDVVWRADSARVVDTPLLDFVLEVQRRAANADLAAAAAFSLDASIDSGAITAARMQALYPYDNTLRAVRITGRQLREYLEQSARYFRTDANGTPSVNADVPGYNFDVVAGADYVIDVSRPAGRRVTRLEVRGRPVAPTDSFTLALTNYRQTGGGSFTMIANAPLVYDKQQDIRQLLIDEVRRVGTIRPQDYFTRNWRIEPASAISGLYAQMRGGSARATASAATPASTPRVARPPRPPTRLRIIGTNDFHGALEPRTDSRGVRRGGAAYLATAIRRARAECVAPACESLLVDGGDEFQGTPASNLAFGRPVVRVFDRLGYAAAALGNHEFDWGQDTLRARMRDARYPFLGANVRYKDGRDVPWIRDDTLIVRGQLKVGVIGLASVITARTTAVKNIADLQFVAPGPIVDSLSRRLRARGADYVIVLAHDGAFCDRAGTATCRGEIIEIARSIREPVDAIVSGHTHSLVNADVNGIPVVQAYSSGSAIDVIDLGPDTTTHEVRNVIADSLPPDPIIATLVRDAISRVAPIVNRPIAKIAEELEEKGPQYPLGNLIADAMRVEGQGDVAVMNNGGIRTGLHAGTATYGELFEIQPFANLLYRVTVTGASLRAYFERLVARQEPRVHVSGLTMTYDSTAAAGARLGTVTLANGAPLDTAAQYRVILNDFMALGGEGLGFTSGAVRTEPLSLVDLDAFIAYLRKQPQPVRAPAEVRILPRKAGQ
ncbi:MAG TPA: 5'-nucleotidase C-terminal domain-containing protein [Gemmatimonadaceae bacterium]|nr:5'-nucleotidase C-terminal domain-containing protein [Gemmatimonadaceae bacterium]